MFSGLGMGFPGFPSTSANAAGTPFPHFGSVPGYHRQRSSSFEDIPSFRRIQDPPIDRDIMVTLEELLEGTQRNVRIVRKVWDPSRANSRTEEKILSINVKKGWKAGTRITFPKEGDQKANTVPADIVFTIKDKPHEHFTRDKDNNILHTARLSLKDALTGYSSGKSVPVPTLGEKVVDIPLNGIIKPGARRRIKGEGLPLPKQPSSRADLLVTFEVVFPTSLPKRSIDVLRDILPDEKV